MTPGQFLAAILLAMATTAGGTWKVQDWRYAGKLSEQAGQHKDDLAAISKEAAAQARAEQDKRLATEQQLAIQDQQHAMELSDAQRKQASLRDRLATADVRLSVLLADGASGCNVPTTPGAVGVVHAAVEPNLTQRMLNELSPSPTPATKD